MPRKLKLIFLVGMLVTIGIIVFSSHLRKDESLEGFQDFYHKTKDALDKNMKKRPDGHAVVDSTGKVKGQVPIDKDADGDIDEDDQILASEMAERLKAAEQKAKELANSKSPNKPDLPNKVVGVGSSADGQAKKLEKGASGSKEGNTKEAPAETEEEHKVEQEIKRILKQSPVIIFSKSYCPFSKRAKGLLLEKYAIEPAPYVVELDEHELGPQLQDALEKLTGRRTVPNIMISGKSIGGSDDIAELDKKKLLIDKIKTLGGKTVDVQERFTSTGGH